MTKIYEALEQADNERKYSGKLSVVSSPNDNEVKLSHTKIEPTMAGLHQNIITLLSDKKSRIVQFISTADDEGTSVLVREFAKFCTLKLKRKVLLLDINPNENGQADYFNVHYGKSLEKMDLDDLENLRSYHQIGKSSLYLAKMRVDCEFSHSHSESSLLETIFKIFNKNFDFILIDSPSATGCPDVLMLSSSVDGLLFIVEAEKYRWQVIEKAKQNILSQGGNILGVILNKRRYPIPDFIYNKI